MTWQRTLHVFFWALVLLALSPFTIMANATQQLKARAEAFWQARAQEDWATEYRLSPPDELKDMTAEQFVTLRKTRGPFRFTSVEIGEVAVADDLGWVEVKYTAQASTFAFVPPQQVHIWDVWQLRNGDWYPIPRSQRAMVPTLPPQRRPGKEEALLSQRVQAFWAARQHRDTALVYQFLDPTYRQKVPLEQFSQLPARGSFLHHRVEWTEVIGDRGRVKVLYTYQRTSTPPTQQHVTPDSGAPQQRVVIEEWVKADGQWWYHGRS